MNTQSENISDINSKDIMYATGKRKTSIAKIWLKKGSGKISINGKDFKDYFPTTSLQYNILQPFKLTDNLGKYNISVNVYGGGITGQVEAIRLGICRALSKISDDTKSILKGEGLLTRDPRMVERKKFGQKKARKKFQLSKR